MSLKEAESLSDKTISSSPIGSNSPKSVEEERIRRRRSSRYNDPTQQIHLINFEDFKMCSSMPRYPENKHLCCDLLEIDHENAFTIFISHSWLRGCPEACGWDGRPHPDNIDNEKFRLCVSGIEKIKNSMAPGLEACYIWLDYSCLNQDTNPAIAFTKLGELIQFSDCIFTPVPGERPPIVTMNSNWYTEYQAPSWSQGPYAYIHRGWCRTEMFYAANMEVRNSPERLAKFRLGLKTHATNGVRPHFLYGSTENNANMYPIILPPLQNAYFEELHPVKGNVTKEEDRIKIQTLVDTLRPYMKEKTVGYEGELAGNGFKHGHGKFNYPNGDVYDGLWENDKKQGLGKLHLACGDLHVGLFENDVAHGYGVYQWAIGASYEGNFQHGLKHGLGKLYMACGDIYEGEFKEDARNGRGVMKYEDGSVYSGQWVHRKREGRGRFEYANGDVYEGEWKADRKEGRGVFKYADGRVISGEWRNDHHHSVE